MEQINAANLNFCLVQNQSIPEEGPKAVPVQLDFSTTTDGKISLDLSNQQQRTFISIIQTIFVDMSEATNNMAILIDGSRQVIVCKAGTQGYYNVLVPNPAKMAFSMTGGSTPVINCWLCNSPISGVVWDAS